jgi:hypothetical protein
MSAPRKFSPETFQAILDEFHGDLQADAVGKKYGASYFPTVRRIWVNEFGEADVKQRFKRLCAISKQGEKNPMHGKTGDKHPRYRIEGWNMGYRMIPVPDWYTGPIYKTDKVSEHIIVALEAAGKTELDAGEVVHHKNHRKLDNRPENLEIMSRGKHCAYHRWNTGTGWSKKGATTIPKGSRKAKKASEAHSIRKDDDIV